jgi:MinD superfamily P-loop ATPase
MKQLAILSGKGGTGKTTIASSFIRLAQNKAFADCDVDAPNLHLTFSKGEIIAKSDYHGYKKAVKYDDLCINCGKCEELCKFDAIKNGVLDRLYCEGCGVCEYFCPAVSVEGKKAIRLEQNISGETSILSIDGEIFSTAILKMGNGASGKLVTEVRKNLYEKITKEQLIIIDGSPGIGCPVIASLTAVDMVLIVTEPTASGFSDMKRIIETAERFKTKIAICINKYDVNAEKSSEIEAYIASKDLKLAGKIPFDSEVSKAINKCQVIVDWDDSVASNEIRKLWIQVCDILYEKN